MDENRSSTEFIHPQRVRFDEIDFARVVFFGEWFRYCHVALEDFFRTEIGASLGELFGREGLGFPIVHVEADFERPLRYDESFEVRLQVVQVRSRSVHYRFEFHRQGVPIGSVRLITSCIGTDFQPRELPGAVREKLEARVSEKAAGR